MDWGRVAWVSQCPKAYWQPLVEGVAWIGLAGMLAAACGDAAPASKQPGDGSTSGTMTNSTASSATSGASSSGAAGSGTTNGATSADTGGSSTMSTTGTASGGAGGTDSSAGATSTTSATTGGGTGGAMDGDCSALCEPETRIDCPAADFDYCVEFCELSLAEAPECEAALRAVASCTSARPDSDFECDEEGISLTGDLCMTEQYEFCACLIGPTLCG